MGVVSSCAFFFMSKYLHQSCYPKPMTRVDINDNNQSSNTFLNSWDNIVVSIGSTTQSTLKFEDVATSSLFEEIRKIFMEGIKNMPFL